VSHATVDLPEEASLPGALEVGSFGCIIKRAYIKSSAKDSIPSPRTAVALRADRQFFAAARPSNSALSLRSGRCGSKRGSPYNFSLVRDRNWHNICAMTRKSSIKSRATANVHPAALGRTALQVPFELRSRAAVEVSMRRPDRRQPRWRLRCLNRVTSLIVRISRKLRRYKRSGPLTAGAGQCELMKMLKYAAKRT
jgi:hypothetical protein